jgi:hypothetical protein
MASLYKKPVMVADPVTGERVKSHSKKWWAQFKDAHERLKRVPLSIDETAAQAMLNQLVQRVEREKAGLVDPTEEQRKRLLTDHIREFESHLRNKGVSDRQFVESIAKLRKLVAARKWPRIGDITAGGVLEFLGQLRRDGLSAQTYNNYLTAIKQFTRWLVRDRRTPIDPLVHLSKLNVRTDRRHDRRALSQDEFAWLAEAARTGRHVESIAGDYRGHALQGLFRRDARFDSVGQFPHPRGIERTATGLEPVTFGSVEQNRLFCTPPRKRVK